eukprot:m.110626 g.110626  ORF g.110626 m.110626 type:complete len:64 (+) comp16061_c0_seq2:173-364(+)
MFLFVCPQKLESRQGRRPQIKQQQHLQLPEIPSANQGVRKGVHCNVCVSWYTVQCFMHANPKF